MNETNERSVASAGSLGGIDAHELMCELHHIAGSEQHDPDVRRTASDAESAIARLIYWVHQLQVNTAEREALEWAAKAAADPTPVAWYAPQIAATLRGLLERTK